MDRRVFRLVATPRDKVEALERNYVRIAGPFERAAFPEELAHLSRARVFYLLPIIDAPSSLPASKV
jgi:hypothetical protein